MRDMEGAKMLTDLQVLGLLEHSVVMKHRPEYANAAL